MLHRRAGRGKLSRPGESGVTRVLGALLVVSLALVTSGWLFKGELAPPAAMRPELGRDPVQTPTSEEPFSFVYKGKECRVRPVAEYELWGLVVSHNDIESVADIYHDSTSVDTKDLCVIWGANLERPDYRRVEFRSGSFTCYFRYPPGVHFSLRSGSNNHLITDRPEIRDRIASVRVGDQVHLKGLLVDYQMDDWRDFWRRSSTVRTDSGCEVVFVRELEILERGTPGWYLAYRLGWLGLILVPAAYLVTLHLSIRRQG